MQAVRPKLAPRAVIVNVTGYKDGWFRISEAAYPDEAYPQGGNTGLVGGQIPFETGHEVVVSLERLNRVRDIDLASNTMTVEAGLVLAQAHDHGVPGADAASPQPGGGAMRRARMS